MRGRAGVAQLLMRFSTVWFGFGNIRTDKENKKINQKILCGTGERGVLHLQGEASTEQLLASARGFSLDQQGTKSNHQQPAAFLYQSAGPTLGWVPANRMLMIRQLVRDNSQTSNRETQHSQA